MSKITQSQVKHIAALAHLTITDQQSREIESAFAETLAVIDNLRSVKIEGVEPTHQVTGMENVWRDDVVDEHSQLEQSAALMNAKNTHEGFFVVPRLIDQDA